jgi:hypothetical protein
MAQVMPGRTVSQQIDASLDYLKRTWEGIPLDAAEWHEWDDHSRLVYELNWGVPESYLAQLEEWAMQGHLTGAQQARYDELLHVVAANRPVLETMLAE